MRNDHFYINFITLGILFMVPCYGQGTTALGDPKCTINSVTEQSTVFSNESLEVLKEAVKSKSNQVKNSFQISPPSYPTTGWKEDLIKEVKKRVSDILNDVKDAVLKELEAATKRCLDEIQSIIAAGTPNLYFSNLYTYKRMTPHKGTWGTPRVFPTGFTSGQVKGGAGFESAASVELVVGLTIPAKLKGALTGSVEIITPTGAVSYPPDNGRTLSVSAQTAYKVTVGFDLEITTGFTLIAGSSITQTVPGNDVSAVLTAGTGHLIYPEQKTESYQPRCEY